MWDPSSQTRNRIHVPCIGKQILNHWTTRDVPSYHILTRSKEPEQSRGGMLRWRTCQHCEHEDLGALKKYKTQTKQNKTKQNKNYIQKYSVMISTYASSLATSEAHLSKQGLLMSPVLKYLIWSAKDLRILAVCERKFM